MDYRSKKYISGFVCLYAVHGWIRGGTFVDNKGDDFSSQETNVDSSLRPFQQRDKHFFQQRNNRRSLPVTPRNVNNTAISWMNNTV